MNIFYLILVLITAIPSSATGMSSEQLQTIIGQTIHNFQNDTAADDAKIEANLLKVEAILEAKKFIGSLQSKAQEWADATRYKLGINRKKRAQAEQPPVQPAPARRVEERVPTTRPTPPAERRPTVRVPVETPAQPVRPTEAELKAGARAGEIPSRRLRPTRPVERAPLRPAVRVEEERKKEEAVPTPAVRLRPAARAEEEKKKAAAVEETPVRPPLRRVELPPLPPAPRPRVEPVAEREPVAVRPTRPTRREPVAERVPVAARPEEEKKKAAAQPTIQVEEKTARAVPRAAGRVERVAQPVRPTGTIRQGAVPEAEIVEVQPIYAPTAGMREELPAEYTGLRIRTTPQAPERLAPGRPLPIEEVVPAESQEAALKGLPPTRPAPGRAERREVAQPIPAVMRYPAPAQATSGETYTPAQEVGMQQMTEEEQAAIARVRIPAPERAAPTRPAEKKAAEEKAAMAAEPSEFEPEFGMREGLPYEYAGLNVEIPPEVAYPGEDLNIYTGRGTNVFQPPATRRAAQTPQLSPVREAEEELKGGWQASPVSKPASVRAQPGTPPSLPISPTSSAGGELAGLSPRSQVSGTSTLPGSPRSQPASPTGSRPTTPKAAAEEKVAMAAEPTVSPRPSSPSEEAQRTTMENLRSRFFDAMAAEDFATMGAAFDEAEEILNKLTTIPAREREALYNAMGDYMDLLEAEKIRPPLEPIKIGIEKKRAQWDEFEAISNQFFAARDVADIAEMRAALAEAEKTFVQLRLIKEQERTDRIEKMKKEISRVEKEAAVVGTLPRAVPVKTAIPSAVEVKPATRFAIPVAPHAAQLQEEVAQRGTVLPAVQEGEETEAAELKAEQAEKTGTLRAKPATLKTPAEEKAGAATAQPETPSKKLAEEKANQELEMKAIAMYGELRDFGDDSYDLYAWAKKKGITTDEQIVEQWLKELADAQKIVKEIEAIASSSQNPAVKETANSSAAFGVSQIETAQTNFERFKTFLKAKQASIALQAMAEQSKPIALTTEYITKWEQRLDDAKATAKDINAILEKMPRTVEESGKKTAKFFEEGRKVRKRVQNALETIQHNLGKAKMGLAETLVGQLERSASVVSAIKEWKPEDKDRWYENLEEVGNLAADIGKLVKGLPNEKSIVQRATWAIETIERILVGTVPAKTKTMPATTPGLGLLAQPKKAQPVQEEEKKVAAQPEQEEQKKVQAEQPPTEVARITELMTELMFNLQGVVNDSYKITQEADTNGWSQPIALENWNSRLEGAQFYALDIKNAAEKNLGNKELQALAQRADEALTTISQNIQDYKEGKKAAEKSKTIHPEKEGLGLLVAGAQEGPSVTKMFKDYLPVMQLSKRDLLQQSKYEKGLVEISLEFPGYAPYNTQALIKMGREFLDEITNTYKALFDDAHYFAKWRRAQVPIQSAQEAINSWEEHLKTFERKAQAIAAIAELPGSMLSMPARAIPSQIQFMRERLAKYKETVTGEFEHARIGEQTKKLLGLGDAAGLAQLGKDIDRKMKGLQDEHLKKIFAALLARINEAIRITTQLPKLIMAENIQDLDALSKEVAKAQKELPNVPPDHWLWQLKEGYKNLLHRINEYKQYYGLQQKFNLESMEKIETRFAPMQKTYVQAKSVFPFLKAIPKGQWEKALKDMEDKLNQIPAAYRPAQVAEPGKKVRGEISKPVTRAGKQAQPQEPAGTPKAPKEGRFAAQKISPPKRRFQPPAPGKASSETLSSEASDVEKPEEQEEPELD